MAEVKERICKNCGVRENATTPFAMCIGAKQSPKHEFVALVASHAPATAQQFPISGDDILAALDAMRRIKEWLIGDSPATAGSACSNCGKGNEDTYSFTVCADCWAECKFVADSPAPSAPATCISNSGFSGYIRVPAPVPNATQSGASAKEEICAMQKEQLRQAGLDSSAGSAEDYSTSMTTSGIGAAMASHHTSTNTSAGTATQSSISESGASATQGARWMKLPPNPDYPNFSELHLKDYWCPKAGCREASPCEIANWAARISSQLNREHKWLNDAATAANSDLDQVASVVERLKAELERIYELLNIHGIQDTDELKHTLEDHGRWRKEIVELDVKCSELERAVSELRSRMAVALKTDEVK